MVGGLPQSVRYVKQGRRGLWWPVAKAKGQLHAGWSDVPDALIRSRNYEEIKDICPTGQDFEALKCLLDRPSQHVWITFQASYMWWCTVQNDVTIREGDDVEINEDGERLAKGHFWLNCDDGRRWSNLSLSNRLLTITDLPGDVAQTQRFSGTVCKPSRIDKILRIIRGQQDPDALSSSNARHSYQQSIKKMIQTLSPYDFELLISLILERTGWVRLSRVGGPIEGIDMEVENWAIEEHAFVQVKSTANQET